MKYKELDIVLNWATKEGWNPGLHDSDLFFTTDPKGFFIGILDGKPIASISAVRYSKDFGFLGLYIVKQGFRGRDYGIKIWKKALEYLSVKNIGLDGVITQQENYKKSGFNLVHRNFRYQGITRKFKIKSKNIIKLSKSHLV